MFLMVGDPAAVVGAFFAFARDRPVHSSTDSPSGCSLSGVIERFDLSLEQKRAYFDAGGCH
jgi:hypothetical protein